MNKLTTDSIETEFKICDFSIKSFKSLESTNFYALKNYTEFNDKDVITADFQTGGKGRLGRKWFSKDGNAYLSIVLKPVQTINNNLPLANLTQYMSVVLCRLLSDYDISAEIKWPNDVLIEGKKIAGILSEASIQGETLKCFILGIGINLNLTEDDLKNIDQPATAMNLLLKKSVDKNLFINQLLNEFFKGYDAFLNDGFIALKDEYEQRATFLGKKVTISQEKFFAKEINNDGSLKVIDENQNEKNITIGDLVCQ